MLGDSKIVSIVEIPKHFNIVKGKVKKTGDAQSFYLVTYNIDNKQLSILLLKKDKRMVQLLIHKNCHKRQTTINDIANMIVYSIDILDADSTSYETLLDAVNSKEVRKSDILERLNTGEECTIGHAGLCIGKHNYRIRHDILIKNNRIRLLYNKLYT